MIKINQANFCLGMSAVLLCTIIATEERNWQIFSSACLVTVVPVQRVETVINEVYDGARAAAHTVHTLTRTNAHCADQCSGSSILCY